MSRARKIVENNKPYLQKFEFDKNQVDRILHLLVLKSRCLRQDNSSRLQFNYAEPAETFFGAIALAVDSVLLAQVNDEVTACLDNRGPMRALIEKVKDTARVKGIEMPGLAIDNFPELFSNRTEPIIGSCFLDFAIGTYSAFEMFMVRICEQLRPKYPRTGKREKRIVKLIEKYNNAASEEKEEALRCIIKAGGSYVAGAEKIEFVMSKLPRSSERDPAKDQKIIKFYANVRNSIHNLGKSASAKDFVLPTADAEISLLSGQPMFLHDYSDVTRLYGDLVEIYFSVIAQNADLDVDVFFIAD